jgi:hypothetical protein
MDVYRVSASDSRQIKMFSSWALFKTVSKRLSKYHTFLIAFNSSAVAAYAFFLIAFGTRTHRVIAQDTLTKMSYRIRIKPFCNGGSGYVVTVIVIEFVRLLTTNT